MNLSERLEERKGHSRFADVLIDIALRYTEKEHDEHCRIFDSRECCCRRGELCRELVKALGEPGNPFRHFRARAPFDIKEGEFFLIDLETAKVLREETKLVEPEARPDNRKADVVNHPSHYNFGKIEVIEFIEDQRLNYHVGNTVKYICRAGRKDPTKEIEDLEKAAWYLKRRVEALKAVRDGRPTMRPNEMTKG